MLDNREWLQHEVREKSLRTIASELDVAYSKVQATVKKLEVVIPKRTKYYYTEESRKSKSESVKIGLQKRYPNGRYGKEASNWRGGKPLCQEYGCTTVLSRMDATYCKRHRTKGERSPGWRGGTQDFNMKIRCLPEYFAWRKAVFNRDNYVCVIGGKEHGNKLEADHIIAFAEIIEKFDIKTIEEALACNILWDISNGRTLCKECHAKTKNYGRRRKMVI